MFLYIVMAFVLGLACTGILLFLFFRRRNRGSHKMTETTLSGKRRPVTLAGKICILIFILIFTAGFMITGGLIFYFNRQEDLRYTDEASGTVIEYARKWDNTDGTYGYIYAPVIRYQTNDSQICLGTGNIWTSGRPFDIGEQVALRYDPNRTDMVLVEGYGASIGYRAGIVFFLIGFVAAVILGLYFIRNRLRNPARRSRITGRVIGALTALLIAGVWICLAGIRITAAVFALLGIYALSMRIKKKRGR